MKKVKILLIVLATFLASTNIYAYEGPDWNYKIEDSKLMDIMKKYDLNNDGIIYNSEYESVNGVKDILILDNNNITSVKGLDDMTTIWELHMKNCNLSQLPEGIEDVDAHYLYLNDNNLTDSDELLSLLSKRVISKDYIYIEGNPCAEEVIYRDFNYRFYNLSIVGAVGETYWQKTNDRSELRVDLMDAGIIDDVIWEDKIIGEADFLEMEWEFSIEDESIAKIEGESLLERDFEFDPEKYASACMEDLMYYKHQTDPVITVKLLKEGRTRMKITCGDYVKYTDIIVLPEHNEYCGAYAMPSISDIGMVKLVSRYTATTYSGIYRNAYEFFNRDDAVINGNVAFVKDFTSFSDMKEVKKLKLLNYTADMINQILYMENIPNLTCVAVNTNDDEQACEELFMSLDKKISNVKGAGWVTIKYDNSIEARYVDVNSDEKISARDALSILKHIAKLEEMSTEQISIADVSNDGLVNTKDALYLLEIAAGIR